MTNKSIFDVFGAATYIDAKEIEPIAVRVWAHGLISKSKQSTNYFDEAFDFNPNTKRPNGTIYKWLKNGKPVPQLRKNDGNPGVLQRILAENPQSLKVLYSPGWLILSGPVSISALDSLLMALDWKVYSIWNQHMLTRSLVEIGDSDSLTKASNVKRYVAAYLVKFSRIGTLDAFFAMVAFVCDFCLMKSHLPEEAPVFNFVPDKWKFCNDLPPDLVQELGVRIKLLAQVYYKHQNFSISMISVHNNIFTKTKLRKNSVEGLELFRLLFTGLMPENMIFEVQAKSNKSHF